MSVNVKALAEVQGAPVAQPGRCPQPLAYRSMADIGPARICGRQVMPGCGFCGLHDPMFKPQRDARGRILPRAKGAE